jgi:GT2 family glycosyltransferase
VSDGLTVVIPTRDRPHLLERCLATVDETVRAQDEVIVADASTEPSATAAVVANHKARVLQCDRAGASYQRNAGAAAARRSIVAFVDDDVRVSNAWASAVERAFELYPDVAFLTGRVAVPPEQAGYSRPVAIKDEPDPADLTPATRGTLGHSANLAVRSEAFERVGGFDERIGPGRTIPAAEDSELLDRLFAAGFQGRYEPDALAWHDQWRTRNELVKLEWRYGLGTGARLARLRRLDRARARSIAADEVWRKGIKLLPSLLRERYEFGVLFVSVRTVGTAVGFVKGNGRALR